MRLREVMGLVPRGEKLFAEYKKMEPNANQADYCVDGVWDEEGLTTDIGICVVSTHTSRASRASHS